MASRVIKYAIDDVKQIMYNGFTYNLKPKTLEIIQAIADQVGSPEYVRTPQFPKKNNDNYNQKSRYNHKRLKSRHDEKINDEDWETIRTFQATEMVKKEGIDAVIDNIRKHLNKITDKTYNSLKDSMMEELRKIISDTEEIDENLMKQLNKIGNAIFGIASSNKFYSEMYAKLYKELMEEFSFMEAILKKNFNEFSSLFREIKYCDPKEDYDQFCENNKTNEKRRAISHFYVNLMKYDLIDKDDIINIIMELQIDVDRLIDEENQKNVVEELSEIMYILVTNSAPILNVHSMWSEIINNITRISGLKVKMKPSISSKTIFKYMDIIDILE